MHLDGQDAELVELVAACGRRTQDHPRPVRYALRMSCEIVSTPGALFCVWGTPRLADLEQLHAALRASVVATRGPIIYVTRVPASAPPPESHVRNAISRTLPEFVTSCSSYHVVLEGDGFAAACKRGVLLSLFQLSDARHKFRVHSCVDAVLASVGGQNRTLATKLLDAARKQGLLDRSCLSTPAARQ